MSEKPKWTPGPWIAEADQDRVDFSILGGATYEVRVAVEVCEPDSRIITAAPEMMEFIQAAEIAIRLDPYTRDSIAWRELGEAARAALRKAGIDS